MQQLKQDNINMLLEKMSKLGKGVYVLTPFRKKHKFFAYLWFGVENFFEFNQALDNTQAGNYQTRVNKQTLDNLQFRTLGGLELTESADGATVEWYELGVFNARTTITAAAGTTITVEDIDLFAVDQIVSIAPIEWSSWVESTVTVTNIDTGAKTITVNAAVTAQAGDQLILTQQLQEFGKATKGSFGSLKGQKFFSVFGKFGSELIFNINEINTTRMFMDNSTYFDNKVELAAIKIYNEVANVFFKGKNIQGDKPVAEWLDHIIEQRENNWLKSKFDITGANEKEKLNNFVDIVDQASMSPVYKDEFPTIFMNHSFKNKFVKSLRDVDLEATYGQGIAHLQYGLETVTSPYVSNISGVVVEHMNDLYFTPTAFIVPRHLICFKQRMYALVTQADGSVKQEMNSAGKIYTYSQPRVTGDTIQCHLEFWLANVFAWISYKDSYMRLTWK